MEGVEPSPPSRARERDSRSTYPLILFRITGWGIGPRGVLLAAARTMEFPRPKLRRVHVENASTLAAGLPYSIQTSGGVFPVVLEHHSALF